MPDKDPSVATELSSAVIDRNVKFVVLGDLEFQTWFHSLYPDELVGRDTDRLFVCSWCFRYTCDDIAYVRHLEACEDKGKPPGAKVYDYEGYAVWEIDGEDNKLYAQNLSLFAKLFLDNKSVLFDVSSFLYYILTYTDPAKPAEYRTLGYFSKEKLSWDPNNLACILIFPPYQHKQLGKLLMGISYKLSAWEWEGGIIGGPERPLSEMGNRSYVRFWEERIARYILLGPPSNASHVPSKGSGINAHRKGPPREHVTIREIGQATGMLVEDVITALKNMRVAETEMPLKKRRRSGSPDDKPDFGSAVIRKQNVLEWIKRYKVGLRDPVREDGFLGEWAADADEELVDD